jgi:hypothetical protein
MSGTTFGLKQRIVAAGSEKEVLDLLQLGKTYTDASQETIRSWKNASNRRLQQLNSTVTQTETVENDSDKPVKKKKKK